MHAQSRPAAPFTVVLDAAHGGPDPGTQISPQLFEKELVLTLSIRLRSALTARGMQVVTTRETDDDPSADDRAAMANHANAQVCLVLHATASGSGVHLYTSSLSAGAPAGKSATPASSLIPWTTAAAPFATRSLELSSTMSAAFSSAGIPYTLGQVQLAPLNSMRCPTVAVEVAPLRPISGRGNSALLSSAAYQQQLVDAMAAGLVAWRGEAGASAGAR